MTESDNGKPPIDKPLILVDGSSYLFRAFHALPQLESSKGQPTGAIKGVVSMIRKLVTDYADSQVAVVFDPRGKTFRNELFSDYKANRPSMPVDLQSQIQPIHDIIRRMGLPLLIVNGVEADDVIGTLARQATEASRSVLISTGDKDLAQLVNRHVTLINTMTDVTMDEAGVIDRFGVRPDQIVDYLALVGDTSDNIPGVPKVGPKTAVKWLDRYQTMQGVIDHADEVGGKVGENLRACLDQLPLSYQLATIKLDVDISIDELAPGLVDSAALLELFTELEFKLWVEELSADGPASPEIQQNYELVLEARGIDEWVALLNQSQQFALHIETSSPDYMSASLAGLAFAVSPGRAAYIPVGHDYHGAPAQLPIDDVLAKLKPVLEDPLKGKIGHNLKFAKSVLARFGIELEGIRYDTMLESYVINSVSGRHTLDDLALKQLGVSTISLESLAGKGAKQLSFNQVVVEGAAEYAAEYADIVLRVHESQWPKLSDEEGLKRVFTEIELPLVSILSRIERNGVLVDSRLLKQHSAELENRMKVLQEEAYSLAGEEFNLGSPKQLQTIFYEKLALPVLKKTPTGQPSTNEAVLQELALDFPLPRVIMEHRGLAKLKSTYTDQLPLQINKETGRIHTSYHQAVAATGRLSSSDPNLQNIPIRTEEGRRIRKAFVAPEGSSLIAADYSQIELRIMAHLSKDKGLLSAFASGKDIHRATAAEVFGIDLDDVEDDQRRNAKAINFGLIYGMSAFGLAVQLNIPRKDAQEYIDLYFERYPGVWDYMTRTRRLAAEQGYVETLYGRRLYLPEINVSNYMRRQAAERTAINAPMQGTAADIIKRAMIAVDAWLVGDAVPARMIMQVHDELVFEVEESSAAAVSAEVSRLMSSAAELDVPLIVEIGIGQDWDAAH